MFPHVYFIVFMIQIYNQNGGAASLFHKAFSTNWIEVRSAKKKLLFQIGFIFVNFGEKIFQDYKCWDPCRWRKKCTIFFRVKKDFSFFIFFPFLVYLKKASFAVWRQIKANNSASFNSLYSTP